MNIVGKNVHKYRTLRELSLEELGKRARWDKKNLHRLEQTGSGYSNESITRLAKALGVRLSALFDESGTVDWGRLVPIDVYTSDMIRRDASGMTTMDPPGHSTGGVSNVLFTDGSFSDDAFAFAVNDEAMKPHLTPGDMVIVDPSLKPEPNDLVLAVIYRPKTEKSQIVIRKYADRSEEFELLPEDNAYAIERPANDNIEMLGTIVEQRKQRRR